MEERTMSFGDLLRKKRKEKGYTLQEVSELSNGFLSPSYINRLEKKDKENPSFLVVCELCRILTLDIREVFRVFGYEEVYLQGGKEKSITQNNSPDEKLNILMEKIASLIRKYIS